MLTVLLSVFVLGSAMLHIRAECRGPRYHIYLFKPLTTFLILLIAVQTTEPIAPFYKYAVIAGLMCSLAGDVFLMLPVDRFISGLVSFLMAHLCYIAAFSARTGFRISIGGVSPFVLYGLIMFGILSPHLGKMKLAVMAYMLVISVMGWQSLELWVMTGQTGALLALMGAVLFIISDSALALQRFRGPYQNSQALIMSTYYAAQWLIALSVGRLGQPHLA